jgi:hypothetical protein
MVFWTVGHGRQVGTHQDCHPSGYLSTSNLIQRLPMPDPKSTPSKEELGQQLTQLVTDQIRPTLESMFIHLHHVYDGINVCQMALDQQDADSDADVARVIRAFILAALDKQLCYLSMLIAGMGGTTDYHEGTDYADDKDESKEDDDEE